MKALLIVVASVVGLAEEHGACGWYLLLPPAHLPGVSIEEIRKQPGWADADRQAVDSLYAMRNLDTAAPLSSWKHHSSHDTAAGCEAARAASIKDRETRQGSLEKEFPGPGPKLEVERAWASRCISTSDPRLIPR